MVRGVFFLWFVTITSHQQGAVPEASLLLLSELNTVKIKVDSLSIAALSQRYSTLCSFTTLFTGVSPVEQPHFCIDYQ